jgi:hypothetical protein
MNDHHRIPQKFRENAVIRYLTANAGFKFDDADNILALPSVKKAALAAGAALATPDANHVGSHPMYSKVVEAFLVKLQEDFKLSADGTTMDPDRSVSELLDEIRALQTFLAAKLTARVDADGKVTGPEWVLNGSDPRVTGNKTVLSFYSEFLDDEGNARGNLVDTIRNDEFFKNDKALRAAGLNITASKDGISNFLEKLKAAKLAGLDKVEGVKVSDLLIADLEKAAGKPLNQKLVYLKNILAFIRDESGSTAIGGRFAGLSSKLGAVDAAFVGLIGLSLWQISKDMDISLSDLIKELDIDISPELIADVAAGAINMAFEYGVITMLTGGAGAALRLTSEVLQSGELATVTFQLLNLAFPEWGIGEKFLGAKDAVDSFFEPYWQSMLQEFTEITFAMSGAKSITYADGNLRETAEDDGKLTVTATGDVDYVIASGYSQVSGKDGDDWMFHSGTGRLDGGGGDDIVFGFYGDYIKKGDYITDQDRELAERNKWLPPDQQVQISGPVAPKDLYLTLDGGIGNDWVVAVGGDRVVTIGGLGRDWIFNTSKGGVIYGDTANGQDEFGNPIPDNWDNSDNIWWSGDVTVLGAGGYDQLKFFGFGMTGGAEGLPLLATGLAGFVGFGINELTFAGLGLGKDKRDLDGRLFTDNFLFNMSYVFKRDKQGNLDLFVANSFTNLLELFLGRTTLKAISELKGAMKIESYTPSASYWGASIKGKDGTPVKGLADMLPGTFGMKFLLANPYLGALALLPPIAGLSGALLGYVHKLVVLSAAGRYLEKFAEWVDEGDPLILDLDGDGIETAMIGAGLRFDHDVNLFAEETGWLGGDDGFLVLDGNGNGRVDDGSEFFGGAGLTGAAELAQFDSNGDGIINAADIIWNDLQVWRDADEDAVTDEGELLSLGDLGITAINLAVSAVNARTPQGTALLDKGAFTWASGGTGLFYDAVFQTSAVDTRFTGEAGRAPWLADLKLDARGFGSIVDLSVAMSNDVDFGTLVKTQSAAMTVPKLSTNDSWGGWGRTKASPMKNYTSLRSAA